MVLVCGGAGYIGSHLVKALRQAGREHVVLDNFSKGHRAAVAGSLVVDADLNDPAALAQVFAEYQIGCVLHFAASIEVGESVADPAPYWRNNVLAVHNLLGAMRQAGVDKIVFSSTAAVYGEPQQVPIPEDHPKNPTNPYGDTKLAVERMLAAYGRAYGLRSVVFRYFNACGADPEGLLGEDHDPETHLIPRILLAVAGKAPQITVFGTDYPTPDGTCLRDFVHVADLAAAHVRAVDHLLDGGDSRTYNLGSGEGASVRQILQAVEEVTGRPVPVVYGDRRPGDPARLVADSSAVRRDLGWEPNYPDVRDAVRHAWGWMQAHPEGYRG
ncbi:MAG: UDP-glucose 4-epimerase GalE [Armatimonadetes bacterium]|nr:UDP-glucose 4-epimerase GalE [Armatimonadota bacterium]